MAVTPVKGCRSFPFLASDNATIDTATITTATLTTANIATAALTAITGRTLTLTATAATDAILVVNQHASQSTAPIQYFVAGEANPRLRVNTSGDIEFGPGGGTAIEATSNIKRSGVATLRTDSTFQVGGALQMIDGANIKIASTTGTKIGEATTNKIGFWNATPIVRPSAFTQTYATADKTHANPTATTVTHAVGTADGTVADVGGAFNQTTLNDNFKELTTQTNALIADVADVKQLCNSIIDDLQSMGLFA